MFYALIPIPIAQQYVLYNPIFTEDKKLYVTKPHENCNRCNMFSSTAAGRSAVFFFLLACSALVCERNGAVQPVFATKHAVTVENLTT